MCHHRCRRAVGRRRNTDPPPGPVADRTRSSRPSAPQVGCCHICCTTWVRSPALPFSPAPPDCATGMGDVEEEHHLVSAGRGSGGGAVLGKPMVFLREGVSDGGMWWLECPMGFLLKVNRAWWRGSRLSGW